MEIKIKENLSNEKKKLLSKILNSTWVIAGAHDWKVAESKAILKVWATSKFIHVHSKIFFYCKAFIVFLSLYHLLFTGL